MILLFLNFVPYPFRCLNLSILHDEVCDVTRFYIWIFFEILSQTIHQILFTKRLLHLALREAYFPLSQIKAINLIRLPRQPPAGITSPRPFLQVRVRT